MTDIQFLGEMKLISQKNKDGLKKIYEEYAPFVYNTAYAVLKNPSQAEDVTSDFFLKLWGIAGTYKDGNGHKRWLAVIVRNMCLDFIRKNKKIEYTIDTPTSPDYPDAANIEEDTVNNQTFEAVLNTLCTEEREIINLRFAGDMTIKEIAKTLDLAQGTVAWRLRQALQKLKDYVEEGQFI